jgi:hypothetical protein
MEEEFLNDGDNNKLFQHKSEGKHRLSYDTIFKGRKSEVSDFEEEYHMEMTNEGFEIDQSTILYEEYRETERYLRDKKVKQKVYQVLAEKTDINFVNNRRKPSRVDFNHYYEIVHSELREERFSHTEVFNELSQYFSDNLFNMFKLLENKWRMMIIKELQEHVGNDNTKNNLSVKNLLEGTEIEFIVSDITGVDKYITGVIVEKDTDADEYVVNSFENIYTICYSDIKKILNNRHKYNLNMLNNIDFL